MPLRRLRSALRFGLALSVIAAAGAPAVAHSKATHHRPAHHGLNLPHASTELLSFDSLPGWKDDDQAAAYGAFLKSCDAILQGTKAIRRARPIYSGLYRVCERAKAAGSLDRDKARAFFEQNFQPVRVLPQMHTYGFYTGADGFFTGYYEATIEGSRHKTGEYDVPIYRPPAKLIGRRSVIFRHLDRSEIDKGALKGRGLEICYVKNPVDAFFAQIQGSARIKLDNGKLLRLNYIASNGKHYTPVGHILIEDGVYTPEEMSMDKIREYMEANPKKGRELRHKNKSFVFFSETPLGPKDECIGAQGIQLTAGRSIAVDPHVHVYGTPIWIDAKFPLKGDKPVDTFQHLMVAQDTGSAIRGSARADIYFGHGEDAPHVAGRIKQFGKFVMLVPKVLKMYAPDTVVAGGTPLPRARPAGAPEMVTMASASTVKMSAVEAAAHDIPVPKQRPITGLKEAAGAVTIVKDVPLPKPRRARTVARNTPSALPRPKPRH
jgi:peptidoglycan lytic transglycosylase A